MKSLVIATGSNLGDKNSNLELAIKKLSQHFKLIAQSRIYFSKAILYENQPDFHNQVLEFELPTKTSPNEALAIINGIEKELGRVREIDKGPRTIDIDILFWGTQHINDDNLTIPHYAWNRRSFVVLPLQELPCFQFLQKSFKIPSEFNETATPL